ncbi:MAG: hypothetical protein KFF49_11815 [Bacteroidales bacterium]|nr:hypothetical protein [Bacteroidales bacterium]
MLLLKNTNKVFNFTVDTPGWMREDYADIENRGWMSLDNAAKIFPPVISKSLSSVFRIACVLAEPIRISALRRSVEETCKRFPYYLTSLHKGFFWYFLEYDKNIRPSVVAEDTRPCVAFPARRGDYALFRIVVSGNTLSVEFLHVLTDGGGALEFLRTLVVCYLRNCGYDIPYSEGIIDPSSPVDLSETEDSYNRYFKKGVPLPPKLENAWHLPFEQAGKEYLGIIQAEMPVTDLKKIAKENNVSITEYLASVYLFCLQEIWTGERKKESHIIRLEIPVNMRRNYPSRTMRNFSLFVLPELDLRLGYFSFDEILKHVHNYMQIQTDKKLLSKVIARNVKPEKNIFIRTTPVFIKDLVLSAAFRKHGATKYSGVLTNVGIAKMPAEATKHIESMSMIPPPPVRQLKVSCGVLSFNDRLCVSFANKTASTELERRIFSYLAGEGIRVRILKNIWNEG